MNLHFTIKYINFILFTFFILGCNTTDTHKVSFSLTQSTNCQLLPISKFLTDSLLFTDAQNPLNTNLPSVDFENQQTKFRLALSDENKNGTYTDSLIDKAYILDYGRDTVLLCNMLSVSSAFFKPQMIIESDGVFYSVKNVKSKELSFQINELTDNTLMTPDITTYSKIEDLEFNLLFGGKANIKSLLNQDKMVYIEFWGTWCRGCIQIIPDLKILKERYDKEVLIVGLNAKDDLDDAKKLVEDKKLNWIQGIADESIINQLLVAGYPFGILLNSKGELIARGIKPNKVIHKYLINN